ncbi:MAG: hypothetical protein ABIH59_03320 [archaeon]
MENGLESNTRKYGRFIEESTSINDLINDGGEILSDFDTIDESSVEYAARIVNILGQYVEHAKETENKGPVRAKLVIAGLIKKHEGNSEFDKFRTYKTLAERLKGR